MTDSPIIQSLWVGTHLTRMERLSILSFLKNACDVHLYVYDEVDNVPAGVTILDANEIIPQERIFKYKDYDSYAGFANLFRYKLLLEKGGYWSDLDIVCLQAFTTDQDFVFASERLPQKNIRVNNCLIGVPKYSDLMDFCYTTALGKDPSQLRWGDTGPKLLTEAVIKFGLKHCVVHPDVFCPVNWWDCQNFISKSLKEIVTDSSCTIHLWNEMWRRNNMDKSNVYNENCVYEELQRMYTTA